MNRCKSILFSILSRLLLIIFPLALLLFLLFPQIANAHSILLRSDPEKLAVLPAAPTAVHLWFSEDLNPAFTTAYVIKAAQSGSQVQKNVQSDVDNNDAHISATDTKEIDLTLKSDLPAGVYIVLYRSQSADDGHFLSGFFLFKVAEGDGTVPVFDGTLPQQISFGDDTSSISNSSGNPGTQIDIPALFSLIMVTTVDLGTIFWVGAQIWLVFVMPDPESVDEGQQQIFAQMEQRFDRSFSWQILLLLFFANIGVLIGQALTLTGGQWGPALAPSLLFNLVAQGGHFGIFWAMREIVILLAILLAVATNMIDSKAGSSKSVDRFSLIISRGNFVLLLALLVAMAESGHASAVRSDLLGYAVFADYLHLVAASLWIGGMIFIALIYLPTLKDKSWSEQTTLILTGLTRYSPFAIAGVVLMALTGPFNAGTRMLSWDALFTTAYGSTLLIKTLLVIALLLISALHVFRLRPQLAKDFAAYQTKQTKASSLDSNNDEEKNSENAFAQSPENIVQQTRKLMTVLRWEPIVGLAVLLCTSLLSTFSGTLQPAAVTTAGSQPVLQQTPYIPAKPFKTTVITDDEQLQVAFTLEPNTLGMNTFTVTILDSKGAPVPPSGISISIAMTLTDLDNGTQTLTMQPDGQGHFKVRTNLKLGGNWRLRLTIHMPDSTTHEATVEFFLS